MKLQLLQHGAGLVNRLPQSSTTAFGELCTGSGSASPMELTLLKSDVLLDNRRFHAFILIYNVSMPSVNKKLRV